MKNPFIITGYYGPEYFCNREKDLEKLRDSIENGLNISMFSLRRMGKSSLIHHLFQYLEKENWLCIYFDIFSCTNSHEFISKFAQAITAQKYFKRSRNRILKLLASLNATIGMNEFTGQPQISIGIQEKSKIFNSLHDILNFLQSQGRNTLIAIDEFQQILKFPETGFEALLREMCQKFNQSRFIFSGSRKNLMQKLFIDPSRPFFQSSEILELLEIQSDDYQPFIIDRFKHAGKSIDEELVNDILSQTLSHTYYTQNHCNRIFRLGGRSIKKSDLEASWGELLGIYDHSLFKIQNDLTPFQQRVLKSIAIEEKIKSYQSGKFVTRHLLNNPASVKRAVESLLEKQYLVRTADGFIRLEDVFLMRKLASI